MNITLDEIRSKAPLQATHYRKISFRAKYYKLEGLKWWCMEFDSWVDVHISDCFKDCITLGIIKPL